jgi:hypothetical protein
MDFINATGAPETERSVQSAPAIAITKTTRITHTVETGFAETTADKRSARAAIGPGIIPFYVFTLEDQHTGETGFALACGDSRIGDVLAVVEQGSYDDVDNPFMGIFYAGLNAYIEDTIDVYNNITEVDIENALNKVNDGARYSAPSVPVTDVGKYSGLTLVGSANDGYNNNAKFILKTQWHQYEPYNAVLLENSKPADGYTFIAGCGPVAIGQIMAFHGKPHKSNTSKYRHIEYDWSRMISDPNDVDVQYSVAVLMYEIGLPRNAFSLYTPGTDKEASTSTSDLGVRNAFRNMGYQDPGGFSGYNFLLVKYSINGGCPVLIGGYENEINFLGMIIPQGGHYWVIDGYRTMAVTSKNDKSAVPTLDAAEYVHCNLGWRNRDKNGWYINSVFDTNNVPLKDKDDGLPRVATQDYFYQYRLGILAFIRPENN